MITASVVLYNTRPELVAQVIKSYSPSNGRQLYIIDNSPEKTNQYLELDNIEYIHNKKNLGYGSAHNIGIQKAVDCGSDYHIVLNPDISFEPHILDELVVYANENKDVVYMLPKVLYPNGELQYLCKLLPTPFDLFFRRFLPQVGIFKKWNDRYTLKQFGYDKIINPPCLSGCFMFMRTSTLREHDLRFDDRFFMYCEDFDLIRRLHRVGKTIFYPYVSIIHNHEKASYKNRRMMIEHMRSACEYFNKYGWFIDRERKEVNIKTLNKIIKEICN